MLQRHALRLNVRWIWPQAPEIVLTKADRMDDPWPLVAAIEAVAVGVPVHVVSGVTGQGCDELRARLQPGTTAVLPDTPTPAPRAALISQTYRDGGGSGAIRTEIDALAYALVRMPATYAAVTASLDALRILVPDFAPARADITAVDTATRARYWQKLQEVWYLPTVWEKHYEWDTRWTTTWMDQVKSVGDWLYSRLSAVRF